MQMSAGDITTYPKFKQYVSVAIPKLATVSVIVNTIKRLSGTISEATIKEALAWGKGPMIKVTALVGAYGEFSPGVGSNEIRLDTKVVDDYEKGRRDALRYNAKGDIVYLAGIILLHELTHWADDQDGVDTAGEEGDQCEIALYGNVARHQKTKP